MAACLALVALLQADEKDALRKAEEAVRKFRAAYTAEKADEAARIGAVTDLGKVRHARTRDVLVSLTTTESDAIRITAAQALGAFRTVPDTAAALIAALRHESNKRRRTVRIAILRSVAELADPASLEALHALVDDREFELAREAVAGCARIKRRESVPILIRALKKAERNPESMSPDKVPLEGVPGGADEDQQKEQARRKEILHQPLLAALRKITGEAFVLAREWEAWWRRQP
ncbi:MAG: HEAT repeat domain-containing protein [Planctomycetes bacterium]|nr:HEAT repeat domain-containing protein [Planctomycetota bacterium]